MNEKISTAPRAVAAASVKVSGPLQLDSTHLARIAEVVAGGLENVQEIGPLSPLQEGMLFHHVLNENRDTYVLSTMFELQSQAQLDVLVAAVHKVMNRHAALRAAVVWEGVPQPLEIVYKQATLPIKQLIVEPDRDPLELLRQRMRPGNNDGLSLRRAPLMRLLVVTDQTGSRWYALLQVHHLICDHQSLRIVIAETMAIIEGREQELAPPVGLRSYSAGPSRSVEVLAAQAFFRGKLAGITEPTAPFGMLNIHGDGSQIEEHCVVIDPSLSRRIREQARRASASPARLLHAAWALVVARTSGRDDVVFGTVLMARRGRGAAAQRAVEMSVNTLPLRLKLCGISACELVAQTHRELLELLAYDEVPLPLAQSCSDIAGSAPLFTALLNYRHNAPDATSEFSGEAGIRVLARGEAWTNYPISVTVDDVGEGFAVSAYVDRPINAQRITDYLTTALTSLVDALEHFPEQSALRLSVLPTDEYRTLINKLNETEASYPREKLVHELFEEQVRVAPDAVALVYEGQSLTYATLNKKANQLARYLQTKAVLPDQLVGICIERSFEMVIGLMGILKAGAAYLPLDPNYPPDRLAYMLADAAPTLLLTQEALRERLPHSHSAVVTLDSDWYEIVNIAGDDLDARVPGLHSKHLAYVIYTSGSTGKPKGAMNEHGGVTNRLHWMQSKYGLSAAHRVLQKTPFSFDVSVWEFFWTLMSGARLIIARPEGHKDPDYLRQLIEETGVTTLHFVPSMLQVFLESHSAGRCSCVQHVVCSGEELSAGLQQRFFELFPQAKLSNLYGPTEAAVDVTAWECSARDDSPRVPLGHPISNIRMYVLDGYMQPLPFGVPGEILIGGVGVGRGYWNRPALTAERFIADPFGTDPIARLYRTGDLGRFRLDGAIEYLGRNDSQVKVRGLRIELGEIEAQLASCPQVKEAVVLVREDSAGEKYLVAYVVAKEPLARVPRAEEFHNHLKAVLPDYMVPSAFVVVDEMPLTPNGKLNRHALLAIDLAEHSGGGYEYEPPVGASEEAVAQIWRELLQTDRIGREDNFFDLGGHSLMAMRLAARIHTSFSIDIPIKRIFSSATVRQLAAYIDDTRLKHLLDTVNEGGARTEELLARISSMPESEAEELLRELALSDGT